MTQCKKLKKTLQPIATFLQIEKPNFINQIFIFHLIRFLSFSWIISWTPSYQHGHHLVSFYKILISISRFYMPNWKCWRFVQMYVILKILSASIWESIIPRICQVTNPTYENYTSCALHHFNAFLISSFVTFLILKWFNYLFIIDYVIFSLIFMRSFSTLGCKARSFDTCITWI